MKKEICHYYPKPKEVVFLSYERAVNELLGAKIEKTPNESLIFDLEYSVKYNINGGGCHIRFAAYNGGTLVELKFVLAQATGARCGAIDSGLANLVENALGVESNAVYEGFDALVEMMNAPQPQPQMRNDPQYPPQARQGTQPPQNNCRDNFCPRCGTKFAPNDNFCTRCGSPRK